MVIFTHFYEINIRLKYSKNIIFINIICIRKAIFYF